MRDEHLDRGVERGLGQRVRVARDEQGPVDPLPSAVAGDGLADGQDVGFGERALERGAAVPGGPERRRVRRAGGGTRRAVRRGRRAAPRLDGFRRRGSRGERWHAAAIVCGHAAAHQPRRAVPRPGELTPDRSRGRPRDARPVDGARRDVRLRRGDAAARGARRRSSRRCAGGSPRCRSGSTTRTGSRRPRSTSATTCARWRWRRRGPTSSSPTRWRGSCRGRSTARGRCGSCT